MNPEKHPLQFKTPDLQTSPEVQEAVQLSNQDKIRIQDITLGLDVIPDEIKEHASQDIIKTLETHHPLSKIWKNEQDEIIGYLAFEDFKEHEAYAKYFATDGTTSENPFSLIPELIDSAKQLGYQKIHFHGFNTRLNKVLEHFGFVRTHTDKQGSFSADHFEINLQSIQNEQIEQKTKEVLENKYLNHLIKETEKTTQTLDEEKKKTLEQSYSTLLTRLATQEDFELSDVCKTILKLKLARYLQRHDSIDINVLFDALIETPKFIEKDKGGFDRLLEIHEEKTLIKIAEMRKKKAEQTGGDELNPYEALFQTASGQYYIARLLNMPHLEEESQYMNHCVGTSDSYINKMKRGDVEILSFRKTPHINSQTQKLEGDEPILTIEYDVRSKTIQQIKKHSDEYIKESDPFFEELIQTLKQLKETEHDTGEKRNFKEISNSELEHIKVKDYHLFTEQGEVHFKDFDPESNIFVLKMGKMEITPNISKEDASKIFKIVEDIDINSDEIAYGTSEVNENTKAYIGPLYPNIFKELPENIEHIYTIFPEGRILLKEIQLPIQEKTPQEYETEIIAQGMKVNDYAKDILSKANLKEGLGEKIKIAIISNKSLGFSNGATRQESQDKAKELGLASKLLPPLIGPELRKQYIDQPMNEYILVDMESVVDRDGDPDVFHVSRYSGGTWLRTDSGRSDYRFFGIYRWAFFAS